MSIIISTIISERVSGPQSLAMQVAALLSDLKSLSVCPHQAAINLVSIHKSINDNVPDSSNQSFSLAATTDIDGSIDSDLKRAEELVSLHQSVKVRHIQNGPDAELLQARQNVSRVLHSLDRDR